MIAHRFRLPLAPFAIAALAAAAPSSPAHAQVPPPPSVSQSGYADLADLVLAAPVIADATIRSTTRIKGPDAAGLAPGMVRLYVEADVLALVRGPGGLPSRIGYLLDVTPDPGGRVPKYKKARVLLFARTVAGVGNQLQLVGPQAQRDWSPALDSRVRAIARAAVAACAHHAR